MFVLPVKVLLDLSLVQYRHLTRLFDGLPRLLFDATKSRLDQGYAMAAIAYLDSRNGTDILARFMGLWALFTRDKTIRGLDSFTAHFSNYMVAINSIAPKFQITIQLHRVAVGGVR